MYYFSNRLPLNLDISIFELKHVHHTLTLIVFGWGEGVGGENTTVLFWPSYWSKVIFLYFEFKLLVFVINKKISNKKICFIKAALLLCDNGYISLNFATHGVFCPPPLLLGLPHVSVRTYWVGHVSPQCYNYYLHWTVYTRQNIRKK